MGDFDADSIDGDAKEGEFTRKEEEEDDNIDVCSVLEDEVSQEKRGPGRPFTTDEYVDYRLVREKEERDRQRKDKELEERIAKIFDNSVPKTKAWKAFLKVEAGGGARWGPNTRPGRAADSGDYPNV